MGEVTQGEGYAVAGLDAMGDGPGFRRDRHAVDDNPRGGPPGAAA